MEDSPRIAIGDAASLRSGTALWAGSSLAAIAFGIAIFFSAFLLFQVQLIIAKYILPWFGGTPAVFTACMLFFQILLLLGYSYSHWINNNLSASSQSLVHSALIFVALAWLASRASVWKSPLLPDASWKALAVEHPFARIFVLLLASVGIPYFLLSTTSPLLQAWWGQVSGELPYRLYALSNAGSLLGLLTYPFLIEPFFRLRMQANLWATGFVLFGCSCFAASMIFSRCRTGSQADTRSVSEAEPAAKPGWQQKLLWVSLAGTASLTLLAVTNQICQDVAVVPLLWVLPLSLYLLSFVVCFSSAGWYSRKLWSFALGAALVLSCFAMYQELRNLVWLIAIYSFAMFAVCMVCHGELFRLRPPKEHLTMFYLFVSAGGVLGGIFVAIIAPAAFKGFWEFPLSLWLAGIVLCLALLREKGSWIYGTRPLLLVFAMAIVFAGPILRATARRPATLVGASLAVIGLGAFFLSNAQPATSAKQTKHAALFSVVFSGLLVGAVLAWPGILAAAETSATLRNFYGVLAVIRTTDGGLPVSKLRHGRILHGLQFADAPHRSEPTTYYSRSSGIGTVLSEFPGRVDGKTLKIGVVGLGVGTLAAYGREGDVIQFYEINPDVIRLSADAANPAFTFIRDSKARIHVVPGDARISLEQEALQGQIQNFDVLVIDAFSGDAIPVHLLTVEALELYLRHLNKSDGVLAFHISNTMLDLHPIIARLAAEVKMEAWLAHSDPHQAGTNASTWMILAPRDMGRQPPWAEHMKRVQVDPEFPLWTDDYSNLARLIRLPHY